MTRFTLFSVVLTASLACLPIAAHAQQDQNPNDKKVDKGATQHPGKPAPKAIQKSPGTPVANTVHTNQFHKTTNPSQGQSTVNTNGPKTFQKTSVNAVNNQAVTTTSQTGTHRSRTGQAQAQAQTQFTAPQGNQANHYGGRWIAGDTHADWGNSGEHYWNHHHYRWYDGGWLIIDPGYSSGGSVGAAVQQRLSEQGYYNGPVDGEVGPGTSRAIANYQADHDLRPTGHISHSLLDSLGLED